MSVGPEVPAPAAVAIVQDVMHQGVVTCPADAKALSAARIMAAHRIHFVVVVDRDGDCAGQINDADVAAALHRGLLASATAQAVAKPPLFVDVRETLDAAVALMDRELSSHLIVAEGGRKPLGVVSVLDLLDAYPFPT